MPTEPAALFRSLQLGEGRIEHRLCAARQRLRTVGASLVQPLDRLVLGWPSAVGVDHDSFDVFAHCLMASD